ncbi:MAG: glutamyl-tRNA reductase [Myxococcales bacterium]|nr:glutamyl-tRNA reductase [Myxococcales bacterium]
MSGDLIIVGLSHHTAPVEVRERLATDDAHVPAELQSLVTEAGLHEALLLSTCNRVELYAHASEPHRAMEQARAHFHARAGDGVLSCLYQHRGADATQHAFRVAASLDSLVVGEPQILGQVKTAFELANDAGTVGMLLGRCFTRAFAVAKRVRTETRIAEGTVSISSVAAELAQKIFGDLRGRRALLLGAGVMGETAARSLGATGARLVVINRSREKADALAASCGGEARDYELLQSELVQADVVISSTSSDRFVLTRDLMKEVCRARRHRPLFIIDIAVPRDVDPRVADMDNVFLYDVDDLQKVADEGLAQRRQEAESAEAIVRAEVAEFEAWRRTLALTPTIVELRGYFQQVVRDEVARTLPRLSAQGVEDERALKAMSEAIVNKLLHPALTNLKASASQPEGEQLIAATRLLFRLDVQGASPTDADANTASPVGDTASVNDAARSGREPAGAAPLTPRKTHRA